jgi:hypothetical protein
LAERAIEHGPAKTFAQLSPHALNLGYPGTESAVSSNVVDQIADDLDLVDLIVGDFHAREFLDQDHQFKTVEPVSPEIVAEMSVICDTFDMDIQMFGDERAQFVDVKALMPSRCSLNCPQAADRHGKASDC